MYEDGRNARTAPSGREGAEASGGRASEDLRGGLLEEPEGLAGGMLGQYTDRANTNER